MSINFVLVKILLLILLHNCIIVDYNNTVVSLIIILDGLYFLVSLVATGTPNIRGYVIQGRLSEDGTTIVGEFNTPEFGRHHSCTPETVKKTDPIICIATINYTVMHRVE